MGSAAQRNTAKSPGSLSPGQAEYGGVTVRSASPRGCYDADGGCDGPSVYARRWARSSVRPCGGGRVRGPQDHEHPPLTTPGSLCRQAITY